MAKAEIKVTDMDIFRDVVNCLKDVLQDPQTPEAVKNRYLERMKEIQARY